MFETNVLENITFRELHEAFDEAFYSGKSNELIHYGYDNLPKKDFNVVYGYRRLKSVKIAKFGMSGNLRQRHSEHLRGSKSDHFFSNGRKSTDYTLLSTNFSFETRRDAEHIETLLMKLVGSNLNNIPSSKQANALYERYAEKGDGELLWDMSLQVLLDACYKENDDIIEHIVSTKEKIKEETIPKQTKLFYEFPFIGKGIHTIKHIALFIKKDYQTTYRVCTGRKKSNEYCSIKRNGIISYLDFKQA